MPDTITLSAEQAEVVNSDNGDNEDSKAFDEAFGGSEDKSDAGKTDKSKEVKDDEQGKQDGKGEGEAGSDDAAPKDSGKAGGEAGSGDGAEAGKPEDKSEKGLTEEKLTAQQKLERRAQEIAAAALEPDEVKNKAAPEKPKKPDEAGKAEAESEVEPEEAVQELSKSIKELLDSDDLKGAEIDTGKEKISLKEFSKQYPEVTQHAVILARAMAKQASTEVRKEVEQVKSQLEQAMFWQEVQDAHPDAKKIVRSEGYDKWLKQQTRLVQRMDLSKYAEDGIAVLDAYKEYAAKTSKPKKDAVADDAKKDTDDVLKHSLASKKTIAGLRDEAASEDDFSAAFNAE